VTGLTFEQKLAQSNNRPEGFNYLRISLAMAIFLSHCFAAVHDDRWFATFDSSPFRPLTACLVPMFFALSGFLVASSLERSRTLVNFLGLRGLRIFPALIVEVVLSAFVLGPIVTALPPGKYYADPMLRSYMLNIAGYIHYNLPGVFLHNARRAVNSQLWTVPFELECYLSLASLVLVGIARRKYLMLICVTAIQLAWSVHYALQNHFTGGELNGDTVPGRTTVFCFLAGVLLYLFRSRVPWSGPLATTAAVVTWICLLTPAGCTIAAAPAAYLTVWLGLMNPPPNQLLASGDYSYGLYLFSVPIQNTVASWGPWAQHWWVILLIGGPLSAGFAFLSWHGVEKHALKLRVQLKRVEDHYLALRVRLLVRLGIGRVVVAKAGASMD
jgi:peptidoglycan/LPS O-acetylase OafA/YrhL